MRDALRTWGATAAFLALWVAVYGGASAASAHVPWRVRVALPWEPLGPVVPAAAPVYVSMGALLTLVPLVLRRWAVVRPVFRALIAETFAAAACFVALPVERAPWLDPPASTPVMAWADAMNLERNYLPSLHVTYAVTAALALRRASPAWGALGLAWATAIAASTLALRYHYVADVVAGVALAWAADRWAHRSARPLEAPCSPCSPESPTPTSPPSPPPAARS